MKILLIAGSWSPEREVSLRGAKIIGSSLAKLGHQVTLFDPELSLDGLFAAVRGQDFAFINLHGSPGEDGLVQAMLENVACPYQGSGPAGSFLALNKAAAKQIFRARGLLTPAWELLTRTPASNWRPAQGYPLFIKDNTGGSSLGMEKVLSPDALPAALARLFAHGGEFLAEEGVPGLEVTCGVLGELTNGREYPRALPPILIRPKSENGIFDYASKYIPGGSEELCPAPLPAEITRKIQQISLAAHKALGLRGYSRSDFILPDNGEPVLLETNTLPGMTDTSLIPQEAAAIGLSFEDLLARLLDLGLAAHQARSDRQKG